MSQTSHNNFQFVKLFCDNSQQRKCRGNVTWFMMDTHSFNIFVCTYLFSFAKYIKKLLHTRKHLMQQSFTLHHKTFPILNLTATAPMHKKMNTQMKKKKKKKNPGNPENPQATFLLYIVYSIRTMNCILGESLFID